MKLSVAEILSEATKALRAEYTLGFVPTSSSKGSPVHTFAGDAFAFKSKEYFIRGHVPASVDDGSQSIPLWADRDST